MSPKLASLSSPEKVGGDPTSRSGGIACAPPLKPGIEMEGNTMMEDHMFGNTMWAGHWLWMLVIAIVIVVPVWRICQRTGYPGWMGILIMIPVVNLGLLYFIAFADWPVDKASDHSD